VTSVVEFHCALPSASGVSVGTRYAAAFTDSMGTTRFMPPAQP
jgi:hypothetical protein